MEFLLAGILLENTNMGQVNTAVNNPSPSTGNRVGVRRMIKQHLKIDMTPMVDLGFLLIAFFVVTTELSKPTTMNLYMPKDGPGMPLGESNALTVLLDNNKVYYYEGKWDDAVKTGSIKQTNLSGKTGLRKIIGDKQRQLDAIAKNKEGRNGLMLLIKPGSSASYKEVVDILDETTISIVKKYAIVKLSEDEKNWLKKR